MFSIGIHLLSCLALGVHYVLPILCQTEARPGEFPYMVYMMSKEIDIGQTEVAFVPCSGLLIAPQWVLVAGSCAISFNPANKKVSPIHSGMRPSDGKEEYEVEKKILHENLETIPVNKDVSIPGRNSIGLLKLKKPVPTKDGFAPIKLSDRPFTIPERLAVPTWSRSPSGPYFEALKYVEVDVTPLDTRRKLATDYLRGRDKMICGPKSSMENFYQKGPLVRRGGIPTNDVLVGIFILLQPLADGTGLSIFLSIGEYRDWIRSKTGV